MTKINVHDLLVEPERATEPSTVTIVTPDENSPAGRFKRQVNAYYALPRPEYERDEVRFSPSQADACERMLYFMMTNAPTDQTELTPWKQRLARNGTAIHDYFQRDLTKMPEVLRDAGKDALVEYEPLLFWHDEKQRWQFEHVGKRSFDVNGRTVTLGPGKCDGQFRERSTGEIVGFEFKTKDKARNLSKVRRNGAEPYHRIQIVTYSLIFGIDRWFIVYESLSKPEWRNDEGDDLHVEEIVITPDEKHAVLSRLAGVVEAVDTGVIPAGDFGKCGFCVYKDECAKVERGDRSA